MTVTIGDLFPCSVQQKDKRMLKSWMLELLKIDNVPKALAGIYMKVDLGYGLSHAARDMLWRASLFYVWNKGAEKATELDNLVADEVEKYLGHPVPQLRPKPLDKQEEKGEDTPDTVH